MRIALALLVAGTTGNAFAACSGHPAAPLELTSWDARAVDDATTAFHLEIQSKLKKPVRMVDGYVTFKDALGDEMGAFSFPRDEPIAADTSFTKEIKIGSMVIPRILKISKDDAKASICISGVIYDDGSKEEFK